MSVADACNVFTGCAVLHGEGSLVDQLTGSLGQNNDVIIDALYINITNQMANAL
jgi:hypothetical protein